MNRFDNITDWTPFLIMQWHSFSFPKTDAKTQVERVGEEIAEYKENGCISEIADCLIACYGVGRFDMALMHASESLIGETYRDRFTLNELKQAINEKMKINLERWKNGEWVYNEKNGQYER